jgi:hypothetical protein
MRCSLLAQSGNSSLSREIESFDLKFDCICAIAPAPVRESWLPQAPAVTQGAAREGLSESQNHPRFDKLQACPQGGTIAQEFHGIMCLST